MHGIFSTMRFFKNEKVPSSLPMRGAHDKAVILMSQLPYTLVRGLVMIHPDARAAPALLARDRAHVERHEVVVSFRPAGQQDGAVTVHSFLLPAGQPGLTLSKAHEFWK